MSFRTIVDPARAAPPGRIPDPAPPGAGGVLAAIVAGLSSAAGGTLNPDQAREAIQRQAAALRADRAAGARAAELGRMIAKLGTSVSPGVVGEVNAILRNWGSDLRFAPDGTRYALDAGAPDPAAP